MSIGIRLTLLAIALAFMVSPSNALAFKLATESTEEVRKLSSITSRSWGLRSWIARRSIDIFTEPVHEEITNRAYGCDGDVGVCGGAEASFAPAPVLAGVRWNDDPPFRITPGQGRGSTCKVSETIRYETQADCWVFLFRAASKDAKDKQFGPGYAMLYRTHFGDLQPLHAMAVSDGETAAGTKRMLMEWIEFTWRISLGEYGLEKRLNDVEIPFITDVFGKTDWRVQDLFTQGSGAGLRRHIDDVAFGSLLHAVQDSFALGHADREESSGLNRCSAGEVSVTAPGSIMSFHSYVNQDEGLHAAADSRRAFLKNYAQEGDVVEISRAIVEARRLSLAWESAAPLFDCVFTLRNPAAKADAGAYFIKEP